MVGFFLCWIATLARKFTKRALDLQEQAILLASRRLVFQNWADAHTHLAHIGYYRFTGYLHPFKIGGDGPDAEEYRPGTTFELVHDRYVFDRKLRILIFEAIEKVEIAARSTVSNSLASRHGSHWYLDQKLFAKPTWLSKKAHLNLAKWHADFIADIQRQIGHAEEHRRDIFIKHYYNSYSDPDMPPCWMVFETISFGTISYCFKFLRQPECREICKAFGLNHQVLASWLHSISYVRNLCAHHSRVWNRRLTIKPIIPHALRIQFSNQNDRIYAVLLAIQIILRNIWGDNNWAERLSGSQIDRPNDCR